MHTGEATVSWGFRGNQLLGDLSHSANVTVHIGLDRDGLLDVTYVGNLTYVTGANWAQLGFSGGTTIQGAITDHEEYASGGWFRLKPEVIG